MTHKERKNRNPAIEVTTMTREEIDRIPRVHWRDLAIHRVYILDSARHTVTMNYWGMVLAGIDPGTLDSRVAVMFEGPRANLRVFLAPQDDGSLKDGEGNTILIREFHGEDA